jgi:hypothetical protein
MIVGMPNARSGSRNFLPMAICPYFIRTRRSNVQGKIPSISFTFREAVERAEEIK